MEGRLLPKSLTFARRRFEPSLALLWGSDSCNYTQKGPPPPPPPRRSGRGCSGRPVLTQPRAQAPVASSRLAHNPVYKTAKERLMYITCQILGLAPSNPPHPRMQILSFQCLLPVSISRTVSGRGGRCYISFQLSTAFTVYGLLRMAILTSVI